MPHGAVVDEQGTTQDIASNENDDVLTTQVCPNHKSEATFEPDLREPDRGRMERLGLLASGGADLGNADLRNLELREHRSIDGRNRCSGIDQPSAGYWRRHGLTLLLKHLNKVRVERDFDRQYRSPHLEAANTWLRGRLARWPGRLFERDGIMYGHE